ncbi:MAG: A/G-specific adenine glycosylase [Campylobacterales bacterium]|nr:A/G-specific adenine glycosylase [Campylobacterales bacterium]
MYKKSQQALLNWYEKYGRHDLPWRNTDNLYHVYLSEIMLQQTQVSRVKEEYYPKFLEKYPTLKDLANSSLDEVLASWSGLGYYRRAENLHKSANEAKDKLPTNVQDLMKLSGVGAYTASAVCSFGLNQEIPVVDTNISRVLKRFFALVNPKEKEIWKIAEEFLNIKDPRNHNLGLMDLGSLICLPKNPKCPSCPLEKKCQGKEEPELYTKVKKKEYISMDLFYGVLIENGKIALTPSSGNMYKNMLELPSVKPIEEDFLGDFKHSYTKYKLTVNLYKIESFKEEIVWADLNKIHTFPISSLTKKAITKL